MAEIVQVNLSGHHEANLRFHYHGDALRRGSSVLVVTDGSQSWKFNCRSEGDNLFSISGTEWRRFAGPRMNTMVTLSKEEGEDVYRVRVRQ